MSGVKDLSPARELVRYALKIGAIKLSLSGFRVNNERLLPYFFNPKLLYTGEGANFLADAYTDVLQYKFGHAEVVYGAMASIVAMRLVSVEGGRNIGYAFNCKKENNHDGCSLRQLKDKRVVIIVDDVIGTSESCIEAFAIIHENGGIPIGGIIMFDQQERVYDSVKKVDKLLSVVQELNEILKIPFFAAATLTDLIGVMRTENKIGGDQIARSLKLILDYQHQYGI
jgi:orotate phosphoribosyltransferase